MSGVTKHGCANRGKVHPLYWRYRQMKQRCLNPKHKDYANYGGRGITICDKWLTFKGFLSDIESQYKPELTIDRIDNDKGYSAENIRWVTQSEQTRNMRTTKLDTNKVKEIRSLYAQGQSQEEIRKQFDVSQYLISRIVTGKSWI